MPSRSNPRWNPATRRVPIWGVYNHIPLTINTSEAFASYLMPSATSYLMPPPWFFGGAPVLFTGCSHDHASIHAMQGCVKQASDRKRRLRSCSSRQVLPHLEPPVFPVAAVQSAASPFPVAVWLRRDEERSRPARRLREFAVWSRVRLGNSCEMRRIRSRAELRKDWRRWRLWRAVMFCSCLWMGRGWR